VPSSTDRHFYSFSSLENVFLAAYCLSLSWCLLLILLPDNNGAIFATENQRVQTGSQQATIRTTVNPAKSPPSWTAQDKKRKKVSSRGKPTVDRLLHLHPPCRLPAAGTYPFFSVPQSIAAGTLFHLRTLFATASAFAKYLAHIHTFIRPVVNPCPGRRLSRFGFGLLGASPKD
jgi:hypothetical protein